MRFVNRVEELDRLRGLAERRSGGLAVILGRRRIGKTRLLLEWVRRQSGLYTVADQSAEEVQRRYFADAMSAQLPGFAEVEYRDWPSLLSRLAREMEARSMRGPIVIDELPYLVLSAPSLPSVLQRWVDHEAKRAKLIVAVAGSSQRMMQGIVLDASAPLFGRADVVLDLPPLHPKAMREALGLRSAKAIVESYTAWGGVPRYWELAEESSGTLFERLERLVLSPLGPLHREPDRLLVEETPPAIDVRSVLDAIGSGVHRLSEIAARSGRAATSLTKPISRLIEMGLVRREVPFGEPEQGSKRSLYVIADPFSRLWFRVVAPHRAQLALGDARLRMGLVEKHWPRLVASCWEDIVRSSIATSPDVAGTHFGPGARWWRGGEPEWDVVSASMDGSSLLLGEVKWSDSPFSKSEVTHLVRALVSRRPPDLGARWAGKRVVRALFLPEVRSGVPSELEGVVIVTARHLLGILSRASSAP